MLGGEIWPIEEEVEYLNINIYETDSFECINIIDTTNDMYGKTLRYSRRYELIPIWKILLLKLIKLKPPNQMEHQTKIFNLFKRSIWAPNGKI